VAALQPPARDPPCLVVARLVVEDIPVTSRSKPSPSGGPWDYTERVEIPLPNGEAIPATYCRRHSDNITRLTPDVGVVVPASGIAEELGDSEDFIYDIEAYDKYRSPSQMIDLFVRMWEREHDA
jgi:hypothetical protein